VSFSSPSINEASLPIHFFTIVLNGEPFIRYHLEQFQKLNFPWHWHIIEGLADLKHDTAWSLSNGAVLPSNMVRNGLSIDGTAEYLDQIASSCPRQVTLYRASNGRIWDGKLEMVNAPMSNIRELCLLFQVDSDELWTSEQITLMRELFLQNPDRNAAILRCWYFVGPNLLINRKRPYPELPWRRVWRFKPGMRWAAHEPPILTELVSGSDQWADVTQVNPITPEELEPYKLVFQHFAYVTEEQLRFKETYYGYKGITENWKKLQNYNDFPAPLRHFFDWPWVHPHAMVDTVQTCGIVPLAHLIDGKWILQPPKMPWDGLSLQQADFEKARYAGNSRKSGYHLLPRLIRRLDLKVGVEIGVAFGGHSDAILECTNIEHLYGVDPYRHRPDDQNPMNMHQKEFDVLYQNVLQHMKQHGGRFSLLRMDSIAAAKAITEPVDFVYIEGENSEETVRLDLELWFPKVRDGGVICGHDFNHPNFPGVARAVSELLYRENLLGHTEEEFFWWVQKLPQAQRQGVVYAGPDIPLPDSKQGRGILYVKWGDTFDSLLRRAIQSVRTIHPELPIHVRQVSQDSSLLDKASIYDFSPFDETLYLDIDTIALDKLDYGFEMARRYGLACSICECPWARRYNGISGEMVEYNTGVLFFTPQAKPIFDAWKHWVRKLDSSIRFHDSSNQLKQMPMNDQAGFAKAIAESGELPFILPMNWNLRPQWQKTFFGPIKIWHDYRDVPAILQDWNRTQSGGQKVISCWQPIE
jgi:Methyltransferase domain